MREIWITRHGNRADFVNPDWSRSAELPFDPPLSVDGFDQARQTGEALKGKSIRTIISSPFLRCLQTAHEVGEVLDLPVELEWGLAEWLNPDWFDQMPSLRAENGLRHRYPRLKKFEHSGVAPQFPEEKEQMFRRVAAAVQQLVKTSSGNLLLVGHGASVQGATATLTGVSSENADSVLQEIPCACLVHLQEIDSGWILRSEGCETDHLESTVAGSRFQ